MKKTLKFSKIGDVKSPERGTSKSAGYDFFIPADFKSVTLKPGESVKIPSRIHVNLPEGYYLTAANKSGVSSKRSLIFGAQIIDEDYQGELHIDIHNIGTEEQTLNPGDKIIQFILRQIEYMDLEEVVFEKLYEGKEESERGAGGFGSTGTK